MTYGCGKLFHYLPPGEIRYSWDDASPSGLCTADGSMSRPGAYFNPNSGSPSGALSTTSLWSHVSRLKRSFCQDTLGTNIRT